MIHVERVEKELQRLVSAGGFMVLGCCAKARIDESRHVLVIGPPGAGKSFLSEKLRRLGLNAVDADGIVGLSKWIDEEGNDATYQEGLGSEWLRTHRFVWSRTVLEGYLAVSKDLFLFGVSHNIYDMIDLFDKVFYMDLDYGELEKRLNRVDRQNPLGRIAYEREAVLEEARRLKETAKTLGIEFIDSTLPPEEIMRRICMKV